MTYAAPNCRILNLFLFDSRLHTWVVLHVHKLDKSLHLDLVLTSLKEHNLFCQLPKCVWAQKEIKYLGHIVNATGVKPDPAKVKALHGWNIPPDCDKANDNMSMLERSTIKKRTVHEVRRFLGFMNYFNRFIPKYAEFAGPLHTQTSDKSEKCPRDIGQGNVRKIGRL